MAHKTFLSRLQEELSAAPPDVIKEHCLQCIQAASMACYAYTMAKQATDKAAEARVRATESSSLARKLTETVAMLKKTVQFAASVRLILRKIVLCYLRQFKSCCHAMFFQPICNDNQALVRLYVSAEKKPISFYKFMTMIKPSEEIRYYDNEGKIFRYCPKQRRRPAPGVPMRDTTSGFDTGYR